MISPFGIRGRSATARSGAVNDIVMDQRGTVEEFDDRSKANRAAVFAACVARSKKQERRTQALPTAAKQISSDFRDGRKRRVALPRELLFDKNEVVADQIKNFFGRQQRDGVSPA
jgi:hypothetical protein